MVWKRGSRVCGIVVWECEMGKSCESVMGSTETLRFSRIRGHGREAQAEAVRVWGVRESEKGNSWFAGACHPLLVQVRSARALRLP